MAEIKCAQREKLFHVWEFLPVEGHPTPKKRGSGAGIQDCNMSDLDVPSPTRPPSGVQAYGSLALLPSCCCSQTHYTVSLFQPLHLGQNQTGFQESEDRLCYCPLDQKHPCFRNQSSLVRFIPVRAKEEVLSLLWLPNRRLPRDTVESQRSHGGVRSPATYTNSLATGTLGGKFSLCNFLRPLPQFQLFVFSQHFQMLVLPSADLSNSIWCR